MAILITPDSLAVPFDGEPTLLQAQETILKKTAVEAMDTCEFLWYLHPEVYQEARLTAEYGPGAIQRYRGFLRSVDAQLCEFRALMAEMVTWLDPYAAPYEILPLLAPIVGIDFNYDLPEEYARREIANAIFLWQRKGTRDNFRDWIRFLTGVGVTMREFYTEVLRTNVWGQAYADLPSTMTNRGGLAYATLPHRDEHHATNTWAGHGYSDPPWTKPISPDTNYGIHGYSAAQDGSRLPGYLLRNHMALYLDIPSENLDLLWFGSPFYTIFVNKIDRLLDLITFYGVIVHVFWRLLDAERYPEDLVRESSFDALGETHCLFLDQPCLPRLANVILCTNVATKVTNADGDSPHGGPWLTFTGRLRYWTEQQDDTLQSSAGTTILPAERSPLELWVGPVIGLTESQGVETACGTTPWIAAVVDAGVIETVLIDEAWENPFQDVTILTDTWNSLATFTHTTRFLDAWNSPATFTHTTILTETWETSATFADTTIREERWEDAYSTAYLEDWNLPPMTPTLLVTETWDSPIYTPTTLVTEPWETYGSENSFTVVEYTEGWDYTLDPLDTLEYTETWEYNLNVFDTLEYTEEWES